MLDWQLTELKKDKHITITKTRIKIKTEKLKASLKYDHI